jgi:hypothetical protein
MVIFWGTPNSHRSFLLPGLQVPAQLMQRRDARLRHSVFVENFNLPRCPSVSNRMQRWCDHVIREHFER